jgi:3-oxosteroid 1-dehydrogenase
VSWRQAPINFGVTIVEHKELYRLTRRDVVTSVGALAASVVATSVPGMAQGAGGQPVAANAPWYREVDVICVGTGAAGLTAAVTAQSNGDAVLVLERRPVVGGTTAKSSGIAWMPNNRLLREKNIHDEKADALAFMARLSFPEYYVPGHPTLGLAQESYNLLAAFYENGAAVVDRLTDLNVYQVTDYPSDQYNPKAKWTPDYFVNTPENKVKTGRALQTLRDDGSRGAGSDLINHLADYLRRNNVEILTGHRVVDLISNSSGQIVGVIVDHQGTTLRVRARKAVIFGTGGYAKNPDMMRHFQKARVYGSCATTGAQGDFIAIASRVGAALGNMAGAWHNEVVLEQVLKPEYQNELIWVPPGDSMIYVNRYGERVVDEFRPYSSRPRVHETYDPMREEYTNHLLFMIFDQRAIDIFGGNSYPLPQPGEMPPWVITGKTFDELAAGISAHLAAIRDKTCNVTLAGDFVPKLQESVRRFNAFASKGVDRDFGRGTDDDDRQDFYVASMARDSTAAKHQGSLANPTMHPFTPSGPYYAMIVGNGVLDTNGGPVINAKAQVVDYQNRPIPGLFGAGNCIASPSREAYFGPGGTIGPAMAFGYVAANCAHDEPVKGVS